MKIEKISSIYIRLIVAISCVPTMLVAQEVTEETNELSHQNQEQVKYIVQQTPVALQREQETFSGQVPDSVVTEINKPEEPQSTVLQESNTIGETNTEKSVAVINSDALKSAQALWDNLVEQLAKLAAVLRSALIALEKRLSPETRARFAHLTNSFDTFQKESTDFKNTALTLTRPSAQLLFVYDLEAARDAQSIENYKKFMRSWQLYTHAFDEFTTILDSNNADDLEAFHAAQDTLVATLTELHRVTMPVRKAGVVNMYPVTDTLFKRLPFDAVLRQVRNLRPGQKLP